MKYLVQGTALALATSLICTDADAITVEIVTEVTGLIQDPVRVDRGEMPLTEFPEELVSGLGDTVTFELTLDPTVEPTFTRFDRVFANQQIEVFYNDEFSSGPADLTISEQFVRRLRIFPDTFEDAGLYEARSSVVTLRAIDVDAEGLVSSTEDLLSLAQALVQSTLGTWNTVDPAIEASDGSIFICDDCDYSLIVEASSINFDGLIFNRTEPFEFDGDFLGGTLTVPVPAGVPLLLTGLAGLHFAGRRRKTST